MRKYKASNGVSMIDAGTLHWQVGTEYQDNTGDEYYAVSVGGMRDMWRWLLSPKNLVLTCFKMGENDDTPLIFKVASIQEANSIVLAHALATDSNFSNTIFNP